MGVETDEYPEEIQQLAKLTNATLTSLTPESGVNKFTHAHKSELVDSTLQSYQTKLEYFVTYCEQNGIDDLNDLNGRDIEDYRIWRREKSTDGTLSTKTMCDEMYLLQKFLRYLESIEGVKPGLSNKVRIPNLTKGEGVRNEELAPDRVKEILNYLEQFQYATREHVVWLLFCRTGRRLNGIRGLDLGNLNLDGADPYVEFKHQESTRLKNGEKSEQRVNITTDVADVLKAYIEHHRIDIVDEQERQPLLTSEHGRLSKSVMRKYLYKWSRPCKITGECPHDRNENECEAADNADTASKCPSSKSPHTVRHGHITELLRQGIPKEVIADRCDVSEEIIEKHYDERDEEEKRELRREMLEEVSDSEEGYL